MTGRPPLGAPSFIALGECMIEMAQQENGLYRRGFAGDTFNAAWYARRLLPDDWSVSYGTCVGEDAASDEMTVFMADEGVALDAIRRVPGRTVGSVHDRSHEGERSFSYWRGQSAARLLGEDAAWLDAGACGPAGRAFLGDHAGDPAAGAPCRALRGGQSGPGGRCFGLL
jgi:2-dehydro-3-deoxygluconokinase